MSGIIGFTRRQFNELDDLLSSVLTRIEDVEDAVDGTDFEQYVRDYLDEHGAQVGYSVDGSGDLSVTLT